MRISEAKQCIKELYLHTNIVTALVSERGIGKTSAYRQCAEELGIGYMGLYAAALEGPDFMGLPDKDREKSITRYLAPQFLPTVQAVEEGLFPSKGLLVLEEINRVPSDTISVLYPLLLEQRINGHSLAPGWKIGVTMNPDTLNYSVNSLDDAMLDRFAALEITADLEDYIEYSLHNNPHDMILEFLHTNPDMLLVVRRSADSGALSKTPTPRGWTRVQEVLNNCRLNDKLMMEIVAGIVGPEAAASLMGFLRDHSIRIPEAQKLLADYETVRPQVEHILEKNRLDALSLLMRKTVMVYKLEENQLANLNAFIGSMPEELSILFFKLLATRRAEDFEATIPHLACFDRVSDRIVDLLTA